MVDEKLRLKDVAQEMGVSVRTIRRYIANRELRAIRINKRVIIIRRSDLRQFVNARLTC